jgi:hypothetical protein
MPLCLASPKHPACRAHLGQVIEVCTRVNPRLVVKRARFSALVRTQLERAFARLVEPDEAASKAVDARQEIDLRIGASFTRFQTKLLQVSPGCQAAAAYVKAGVCMWNMELASRAMSSCIPDASACANYRPSLTSAPLACKATAMGKKSLSATARASSRHWASSCSASGALLAVPHVLPETPCLRPCHALGRRRP